LLTFSGFGDKVSAVGVNCVDPNDVSAQLKAFNAANRPLEGRRKVPYVVYPNAGSVRDWDAEKKCWWVRF
jgi:S-methylmethionine-dependent homocysteine/selenocysteine methylase